MIKGFRQILFTLWLFVELVLAFILLYGILFLVGGAIPVGDLRKSGDLTIFVQSNGVHTDLCFPYQTEWCDWSEFIPAEHFPENPSPKYLAIGWGDKGFFLDTPEWSDLTFSTAFNAAFLPSETAMHVACYDTDLSTSSLRAQVPVSADQYLMLVQFAKASFLLDSHERPVWIANSGYGAYDQFYEAKGSYSLFYTCNTWTNEALKLVGIKTGWYALSGDGIMHHLQVDE